MISNEKECTTPDDGDENDNDDSNIFKVNGNSKE